MKAEAQVPPEQKTEKPKSRFRLELTRHNQRLVITDSIDKGRYVSYVISYYIGGNRQQVRRATLSDAKREANLILTKLAQGEPDVLALTSTDRLIYLRACEALSKNKVPLDVAVGEYVYAQKRLNGVGTLTVEDLRRLLENVRPDFTGYLTIAAFAGLRQSEIQRLRWDHISESYIRVPPGQYRVKSSRLVPLLPNLKSWLGPSATATPGRCPWKHSASGPP